MRRFLDPDQANSNLIKRRRAADRVGERELCSREPIAGALGTL
jgi:hypothetical protein